MWATCIKGGTEQKHTNTFRHEVEDVTHEWETHAGTYTHTVMKYFSSHMQTYREILPH